MNEKSTFCNIFMKMAYDIIKRGKENGKYVLSVKHECFWNKEH